MAQENFYNLKPRKQTAILDAIGVCLRKYDYEEISVNDIVREADISRGSFYNYFTDKADAIETLVDMRLRSLEKIFLQAIEESDMKLFDGAAKTYELIKEAMQNNVLLAFMKNLRFFMEIGTKVVYSKDFETEINKVIEWLIRFTDEGRTYLKTKKEMSNVLDMLLSLLLNATFLMTISNDLNLEFNDYYYKLDIIKNGVLKNQMKEV